MATYKFDLELIKKGTFMYWNICSQSSNSFNIVLKDTETGYIYFECNKPTTSTGAIINLSNPDGKVSCTEVQGDSLSLFITSPSSDLKHSISSHGISDGAARNVGYAYDFCFEDWIDEDFNDLYVNVIAWNRQG